MSPDLGHLQDMLSAARTAMAHLAGMTLDSFLRDVKTQDAVLWRLAVIGEAANNVTPASQAAIQLPWSQIIGMRHVAIHHNGKCDTPLQLRIHIAAAEPSGSSRPARGNAAVFRRR